MNNDMHLVVKDLGFAYPKEVIFENINFTLSSNEICAIIGQSGCGKTTLLSTIAKVIQPMCGQMLLNQQPLDVRKHKIGYVMQNYDLMPWLSVKDNCLLPFKIKKIPITDSILKRLDLFLEKMHILQYKDHLLIKLSQGQKQRVSLIRVFLLQADLILLDEAFANLDLLNKDDAIELFLTLWHQNQAPTLFVTHSIDEALYMANNIMVMTAQGKLLKSFNNPLFNDKHYRKSNQYFTLYTQIERFIKGDYHEE